MKQMAFMILKPLLLKWLEERALRIPVAELPALEKRTKLSASILNPAAPDRRSASQSCGPMAEAAFIESFKKHPLGDLHTFAGFDEIRAAEDKFLPLEQLDKYADSIGHQPEKKTGKA